MSKQSPQEARDEEQRRRIHMQQVSGHTGDSNAPETLKYVAEPEEIDTPVDPLAWINSKSASTANYDPEDVRSKEWRLEYHQLMAPMEHPPTYGIKGDLRAFVYDDVDEFLMPLKPGDKMEIEGYTEIGKESSTRSKGGWGVETSTRDTKESIVRDEKESSGGGLIDKIKRS